MTIWKKTKFPGVRYKESPTRRHKKRPERYFSIRYQRHRKSIEEGVGWESDDGLTPDYCSQLRGQIVSNVRTGRGHQTLKEMREAEEARLNADKLEKEAKKQESTPFDVLAQHYLEWSEGNRSSWKDDESRYRLHIKPNLGYIPIKDITPWHMERLKQKLKTKGKSPQTVLHCLSLVRAMFYKAPMWQLYNGPNPVREIAKDNKK